MKAATIYMLEVLVCSGVFLAVYAILLDRRVKFRWCRLYLLLSTAAAALIPFLRIPIWPGRVIVAAPVAAPTAAEEWTLGIIPQDEPIVTAENFCTAVYLLGMTLILVSMLWQMIRMWRLRRGADISSANGLRLVRTPQMIASFSFFRTIFVWDRTPAEEMKAIVAHESSHIRHKHSVERILMELMKAAQWWNPFAWIAARRLTEAEEFEADSDVLNSGYDRSEYMQTIFKQLFGYRPEIANGLRNSLTKKRFKMMTTQTNGRYNLLRLAGTLPALIGLLCAFSFTSRAAVIVTSTPEAETETADVQTRSDQDEKVQPKLTLTDTNNNPIAGATVRVVGTNKGAITDANGKATLDVAQDAVLEITYPGRKSEVVHVGKMPNLAFSITMQPDNSAEKADTGKPYLMVDGQEMDSIDSIDPKFIKSINVIHAPESVAKYGERARYGAIIVELGVPKEGLKDTSEDAFLVTETMPAFNGGDLRDFRIWVQKNINYPEEARSKNIYGRVVLTFIIEKDGSVSTVNVIQSPNELLSAEAKRVIAASPNWTPGKQSEKVVRVKFTLPVDFSLATDKGHLSENGGKSAGSEQGVTVVGYSSTKR